MSTLLQIVGIAALTVGAWLAWAPAGPIALGAILILLGALMERDTPSEEQ